MSNLAVTDADIGNVVLEEGKFRDDLLTFAGAATVKAGTILARDFSTATLAPYVKDSGGTLKAVLTYDVTATGAGDVAVRVMVSGSVRAQRLVLDADGDASNIDVFILDELREHALIPIDVQELNILDNQ